MQLKVRFLFFSLVLATLSRGRVAHAAEPAPAPPAEPAGVDVHMRAELAFYTDTDAVSVFSPSAAVSVTDPLAGWTIGGSYLLDIVSGASVDIVATATPRWTEARHAVDLEATYKPHDISAGLSASLSREPDYVSLAAGANLSIDLVNKQVTPLLGYSFSHDTAGRSDTPFSVYSLELSRHTFNAGLTLVLDRGTELQIIGDFVLELGDQTKPYRFLPMFSADNAAKIEPGATLDEVNALRLPGRTAERTPLTRKRWAATGRLSHRAASSTFIFWERGYFDDWGVAASTTELRWVNDVGDRMFIWPEARFHIQSGATFWQLAYIENVTNGNVVLPEFRSGDRELGPLFTATLGGGIRWNAGRDSNPAALSFVLSALGSRTEYQNALYVQNRYSGITTLDIEGTFE